MGLRSGAIRGTVSFMHYYLIVFHRADRRLVDEVREFATSAEALEARFEREQLERGNPAIEVVVLGAGDRDALVRTHSRYFGKSGELSAI
jgi:hypothetical protein